LHLVRRGLPIQLSDKSFPDAINLVDGVSLHKQTLRRDCFYVGCRSDGPYPGVCQVVIQQNSLPQPGGPATYIPQWTQPGLIPREPSREGIETIGFLGDAEHNLEASFQSKEFAAEMRSLGVTLLVRGKNGERVQWNDYSDIDLIVAVRNLPRKYLQLKPPNKLINAWLAGVPAMLGPEPAYRAIRRSDLDYIEVRHPADVRRAIQTLRRDPKLYDRIVQNGRNRAREYDDDAVANRWLEVLSEIEGNFHRWRDLGPFQRFRDYASRWARYRIARTRHRRTVGRYYRRHKREGTRRG
ncbi:MAG: glycosyltransferase family 1 protein, partial [Candidatus Dadabacteria bacterium]